MESKKNVVLGGVAVVILGVAAFLVYSNLKPEPPPPVDPEVLAEQQAVLDEMGYDEDEIEEDVPEEHKNLPPGAGKKMFSAEDD